MIQVFVVFPHFTDHVLQCVTFYFNEMIFFGILLILHLSTSVLAHGILLEPPSRTSAWRVGFNTPAYYNDSETNCGGFER